MTPLMLWLKPNLVLLEVAVDMVVENHNMTLGL